MRPVPRRWSYPPAATEESLREAFLAARQVTQEDLFPTPGDPRLIHDMGRALAIIREVKRSGGRVVVYGDYDTDGITGVAVLTLALWGAGVDTVPIVPNRTDGFGLSPQAIDQAVGVGAELVITVDNGSDRRDVIARAREKGVRVIVTDHHPVFMETMASPDALVNPRHPESEYPFLDLCGAGVAFGLAFTMAFPNDGGEALISPELLWSLAPPAAVATVADVVPIIGANRAIVRYGLENISKSIGLEALRKVARLPFEVMARDLAFEIAPRINAAGRLRDARESLKLLLATDPLEAAVRAETLNDINEERKRQTEKFVLEARAMIDNDELYPEELRVIVVKKDNWPHGIVGLIAGKLAETYCRPVYVGGFSPADKLIHGSARTGAIGPSGEPISCAAIMAKARQGEGGDLLISGGGHEAAAGFTLDGSRWARFRSNLEAQGNLAMAGVAISRPVNIDVAWELPSEQEIEDLLEFEPTGKGFEAPLLATRQVEIVSTGKGRRERIWKVAKAGRMLDLVGYQGIESPPEGERVDLAYYVERSKRGKLRLRLESWRPSEEAFSLEGLGLAWAG